MHQTNVARNGSLRTGSSNNYNNTHNPSDTVDPARVAISGASFAFKAHPSLISTKELPIQPNGAVAAAALAGQRPKRAPTPPRKPALPVIRHETADDAPASNLRVRDMVKELDSTPPARMVSVSTSRPSIHSRSPSQIAASLAAGKAVQAKPPLDQARDGLRSRDSVLGNLGELPMIAARPMKRVPTGSQAMERSSGDTESRQPALRELGSLAKSGAARDVSLLREAPTSKPPGRLLQTTSGERRGSAKGEPIIDAQSRRPSKLPKTPTRKVESPPRETSDVNLKSLQDGKMARPSQPQAKQPVPPRQRREVTAADVSQPTFELVVAETPVRTGRFRSGSAVSVSPAQSTHSLALQPSPRSSLVPLKDQLTGLTESSLADAIVASSLASSRAPSPSKNPRPPPPRRTLSRPSLFSLSSDEPVEKSASPVRGMRRTLREAPKKVEEPPEYHKKHRLMKKHPHKHHEGDRKRWRDQLTEQERKRYEGVWAANKGLNMSLDRPANESAGSTISLTAQRGRNQDMVLNLVVREIWSRSKLPLHLLEQIWKLVDLNDSDRLSREEFVVGMWLIDQCLKGRKLPQAVTPSVWASVRHSSGIQILPSK